MFLKQWIGLPESQQADMRLRAKHSFEQRFDMAEAASSILRVLAAAAVAAKRSSYGDEYPPLGLDLGLG